MVLIACGIYIIKQEYNKMEGERTVIKMTHVKEWRASWPEDTADPGWLKMPDTTNVPSRNKRDIYTTFMQKGDTWSPHLTHRLIEKDEEKRRRKSGMTTKAEEEEVSRQIGTPKEE